MAIVERVRVEPSAVRNPDAWFLKIPAIADLRDHAVVLDPRVTVIVGENGAGKSTFVEAVAAAWRSKLTAAVQHWGPARSSEDSELSWALAFDTGGPTPHGGCFLRAEAMHSLFRDLDESGEQSRAFGGRLNAQSHGESFLAYLESRLTERGLFILDEPEAALSFTSCLRLLALIGVIADSGSQVLVATHSPLLAAFPGARILEFSALGIAQREWTDLDLVQHWQAFLARPDVYLRHLFDDEAG